MTRVYVETSPAIYLVQQVLPWWTDIEARLSAVGVVAVSSELTRMECLVQPLRTNNVTLVSDFDNFFNSGVAEMVPFSAAVFRRGAEIRARHNFRTPDALHLAAAVEGACDVFLTNDVQLKAFSDITVEVV
jgi:predicted nucleic acid-binding protein